MFWGLPDDRGLPDVAQGRQKTHETHLKMLSKLIMIAFWGLPGDWGMADVAQGRQKAKDGKIYSMIFMLPDDWGHTGGHGLASGQMSFF